MGCRKIGRQTVEMEDEVYLSSTASIAGKKESEGPFGSYFDMVSEDDYFGEEKWEMAESTMQREAAELTLGKAGLKAEDIDVVFAGDLLSQSIASSFGMMSLHIPMYGLFGACSTAGEALSIAAMSISSGFAHKALAVTSSHFATAEKQFRFPLQYANQKPLSASWTVTAAAAFLLTGKNDPINQKKSAVDTKEKTQKKKIKIRAVTTGKMMDFGIRDNMHMGAAMAPAAADTIYMHLKDTDSKPEDYDKIITGDLGKIGSHALIDLLRGNGFDISNQHMDCGAAIYDSQKQDTHTGGSGCGCAASMLSAVVVRNLEDGKWKKVLFVPTGALLSKTSFNEGQNIPGIAHGVVLEAVD